MPGGVLLGTCASAGHTAGLKLCRFHAPENLPGSRHEKELHAGSSGCSSFFSCDRSLFLIFFPERFLFSEIIRIPRSGYLVHFVLA